jgi:hypothetical protein
MTITTNVIGPRQEWQDLTGDWANAREVRDSGIVLTRPDQHHCRRSHGRIAPGLQAIAEQVRIIPWTRTKKGSLRKKIPSRS